MKRTMIAAVALGLFTASTIAGTAALPRTVRAEEGDAGNRTLYEQSFDGVEENTAVGTGFTVRGGAIESTEAFSQYPLSDVSYSYDWKVSMDVTFLEVSNTGFLGLNVNGLEDGITYEFTIGKETGSNATNYIKKTGEIVIANASDEGQGGNPVIAAGTTYRYAIQKDGYTFTASVDGKTTVSATIEGTDKTVTDMNVYTFNLIGVKIDDIIVEKSALSYDLTLGEVKFTENFDSYEAEETVQNNLTATADGRVVAGAGFAQYIASGATFTDDWLLTAELTMPAERDGYFGFNIIGMRPDMPYEFTVQKTPTGGYALIKDGTGAQLYHSNDHGTNPVFVNGLTYEIGLLKVGKMFTIMVDGRTVGALEIGEIETNPTEFNFYTFNLDGVMIDDLTLTEVLPSTSVESVTLTSDKPSISTMQSATIRAEVLPATAKIESVEWKVDDEVVENSGTTFAFSSQDVGEHTIVCTVNGVASAPLTVNVTEPSEDEKNSLFYENFDALPDGTQWGSFTVQNGAAHTNKDYNRYDVVFDFERDFEVTFDVTWNDDITIDSYVGFVVQGLTETATEVEFNFHRAPVSAEEGAPVSNVVVKYNGTERYFSNDPEKGGRLDSLTFETGTTYAYRFVRYNDQFEIYVNDQLAVKYYMKDANSDPTVPTGMFLYTYNESAVPVTIDNFVIRAAEEITDRVEPPVVEVTSAYVTASSVIIGAGESTTLTAQATPFDATVTSYQWYLDGTAISGATEKNYVFTAEEEGEYTFKCLINGTVESESKTITVNAPQGGGDTQTPAETPDHTGLIVGLSVGGVVVVAAAGAVIWLIIRKRRKQG